MQIKQIINAACETLKLDSNSYSLKQKQILDSSLLFRFANLTQGSKLTLVSTRNNTGTTVDVAIQFDDGRFTRKFTFDSTLWNILLEFQSEFNLNLTTRHGVPPKQGMFDLMRKDVYMLPVILLFNKEYSTIPILKSTSLSDAGASSGSAVLKIMFKYTDYSIDQVLAEYGSDFALIKRVSSLPLPSDDLKRQDVVSETMIPEAKESVISESVIPEAQSTSTNQTVEAKIQRSKETPESKETKETPETPESKETETFRNIKIYKPIPKDKKLPLQTLPDSFFTLTRSEISNLLKSQKQTSTKTQDGKELKTSKLRDMEILKKRQEFPKTAIRVKLDSQIVIECVFYSNEFVEVLVDVLSNIVVGKFTLYTSPPFKQLDLKCDFWENGLSPKSLVYVKFDGEKDVIKDEWISRMEDHPFVKEIEEVDGDIVMVEQQEFEDVEAVQEDVKQAQAVSIYPEPKSDEKKMPKWFRK